MLKEIQQGYIKHSNYSLKISNKRNCKIFFKSGDTSRNVIELSLINREFQ